MTLRRIELECFRLLPTSVVVWQRRASSVAPSVAECTMPSVHPVLSFLCTRPRLKRRERDLIDSHLDGESSHDADNDQKPYSGPKVADRGQVKPLPHGADLDTNPSATAVVSDLLDAT
jgi:hypothetical protein